MEAFLVVCALLWVTLALNWAKTCTERRSQWRMQQAKPNSYTSYTHKAHSSHTFLPFPHVSSFRSSSDNWDESLLLHAWLFATTWAVIVTQNGWNLEEQGLSLPAFSMLNFSHLLIFLVWNIGLIAAINVGHSSVWTSCTAALVTALSMPHLTQHHRASLDYVLHNTTTRSCAPPVSILLLGPFISTMVIEVAMMQKHRQGSLI